MTEQYYALQISYHVREVIINSEKVINAVFGGNLEIYILRLFNNSCSFSTLCKFVK